jgi:hypothetical protein
MRMPAPAPQLLEPAGGGVAVHPGAKHVAQDRTGVAAVDSAVDRAGHRGWPRNRDDLAALATYAQHPVAVLLAQVALIRDNLEWADVLAYIDSLPPVLQNHPPVAE